MMTNKPEVNLVGENGNIFNTLSICSRALKTAKQPGAAEMRARVFKASSYEEALNIISEYVDIGI